MSEKNPNREYFTKEEVESLAKKLEDWGGKLPDGERQLLEFLVARAEMPYPETAEELIVVDKTIQKAAYSALEAFINSTRQKKENCILWRRTSAATR